MKKALMLVCVAVGLVACDGQSQGPNMTVGEKLALFDNMGRFPIGDK